MTVELSDILNRYPVDKDREREGVWCDLELADGLVFEVKVAASRTRAYQTRLIELMAPFRETLKDGKAMTDEESDMVFAEAMSGTILTDWRGLTFNGEDIPFTEATSTALLAAIPDFREAVASLASDRERFRYESVEKVAERLGERFGGGSKTKNSSEAKPSEKG